MRKQISGRHGSIPIDTPGAHWSTLQPSGSTPSNDARRLAALITAPAKIRSLTAATVPNDAHGKPLMRLCIMMCSDGKVKRPTSAFLSHARLVRWAGSSHYIYSYHFPSSPVIVPFNSFSTASCDSRALLHFLVHHPSHTTHDAFSLSARRRGASL